MAREARSHVRKRRRGCLGGCLMKIILLLGLAATLFVGACVLGFVTIDEATGAPQFSLDAVQLPIDQLSSIDIPAIDLSGLGLDRLSLPQWDYGVSPEGMTVKTLRAGDGEAVLVCCDGYTMLLSYGDRGLGTCAQLLLCGAGRLSAAVAMSLAGGDAGGMNTVLSLTRPSYLLYPDSQTKSRQVNALLETAGKTGAQRIAPEQGLTFSLGRATVRVVGPRYKHHTDERDDGLSVRVDYGETSVLVMGGVTQAAERELVSSGAPLDTDVLICGRGGGEEATSSVLVEAVSPEYALMTGKAPSNAVRVRLERTGAQVFAAKEHGVMTIVSDGKTIDIKL